ncbi:MAG: hypothetical protein LBG52_03730 [Candidatus Peribacteria bacterium]|nr:hypothetical protein [Candidatus Peribacteria bacterium]
MSSVNNAENTSNTSELTQNLVQTVVATPNNQAIIITTSPEGIPLINRTHRISVDGNVQIELDNTSKAWQYNNEKVVVKQKNAIYISDALSTGFSKIQGFDETQNIDFNDTVFKKYGDIVASQAQYEKGIIKCFLQGKMYTLSEKKE